MGAKYDILFKRPVKMIFMIQRGNYMNIIYEQKAYEFSFQDTGSHMGWEIYWPPHLHQHIEIVYMRSGSARTSVDLDEYVLEEDDLFITFPNQVHCYMKDDAQKIPDRSFVFMIVSPNFIPYFTDMYKGKLPSSAVIKNVSKDPKLSSIIKLISDEHAENSSPNTTVIKGLLYALLGEFVAQNHLIDQPSSEKAPIKAIVKYCSENYKRELTLDILEEELFLSKYYISHILHDKLKMGFFDYINYLRVSEACNLLSNTNMPIAAVGEAVGFKSPRTFNRAFCKVHGISPRKYKADQAQGIIQK